MKSFNNNSAPLILAGAFATTLLIRQASAAIIYSAPGPFTADETGSGSNLPGFALSRNSTASDTLYFKFSLSDLNSNATNEQYFAGFNFYEGPTEKLGIGNGLGATAYSAYSTSAFGGLIADFNSANPELGQNYQLVRSGDDTTIIFKLQFVPATNANVTVWFNPNLSLDESAQPANLTTTFTAAATFDEVHLREGGGGSGWTFRDIAVATNKNDPGFFVPEPGVGINLAIGTALLGALRRRRERSAQ
jgi:hypothetical protein